MAVTFTIFFNKMRRTAESEQIYMLCAGEAQVLHRLPTNVSTLSADLAMAQLHQSPSFRGARPSPSATAAKMRRRDSTSFSVHAHEACA